MKSRKVLIIAEAGVNHNGSIKLAKKLIDVAVKAKADIVKFQTFTAENLVIKNAKIFFYVIFNRLFNCFISIKNIYIYHSH